MAMTARKRPNSGDTDPNFSFIHRQCLDTYCVPDTGNARVNRTDRPRAHASRGGRGGRPTGEVSPWGAECARESVSSTRLSSAGLNPTPSGSKDRENEAKQNEKAGSGAEVGRVLGQGQGPVKAGGPVGGLVSPPLWAHCQALSKRSGRGQLSGPRSCGRPSAMRCPRPRPTRWADRTRHLSPLGTVA